MSPVRPATDVDRSDALSRAWVDRAVAAVEADARRSADTHLLIYPLPPEWGVELYLKDESTHPTGSLKHRLARSLFLYGLCSGQITEGTTVVESSSGSTAVSEAYFARMLGLPFVAVMPASTSPEKVELIEFHGGRCHFVDRPSDIYEEARRLAAECGGHYLDQFSNAERATDWRGNNNIAESIFSQLALERHPLPEWVVVGAGTGGTSATIGRYLRYRRLPTRLAVVDPEGSSFFPGWRDRDPATATGRSSRIEGIGRPRVEPSFVPTIRWIDGHQPVGGVPAGGRDGGGRPDRQRGHPAVRRRGAVRAHLLLRRVAGRTGTGPGAARRHAGPFRVDGGVGPPHLIGSGDRRHPPLGSPPRYQPVASMIGARRA
jgi:cysteine synthase A